MKITYCDKCGQQTDYDQYTIEIYQHGELEKTLELCKNCGREIREIKTSPLTG